MTNWSDGIKSLIAMAAILLVAAEIGFADEAAALEHFERRIRPVLAERCLECHGSSRARNGLRLDSAAAMLQGGDSGPAIVPGNAEASLLIRAISYHDSTLQMPPRNRMSEQVVADFVRWVNSGAVDPREEAVATEEAPRWAGSSFDVAEAREHWSFSPPRAVEPPAVEPPAVEHDEWGRDPIDAFILAKLEARDLVPAEEADRRTLIRRAYFDLIGLPPTPAQVAAFVADDSDGAFAR
ncbi:MAG: c-type cytochrome domain-containing protein, partial [Phycisphaeraceae bacterium]